MGYLNLQNLQDLTSLTPNLPPANLAPIRSAANLAPIRSPSKVLTIPDGVKGTEDTIKEMRRLAREASVDPKFVQFCRSLVAGLPSKAYYDEAVRIFDFVKAHVRYVLDPRGSEYVQDPRWVLFVDGQGDCFVKGTKVLRRCGPELVKVEALLVGDEIWGKNKWSKVTKTWDRGLRKTYQIKLNNGSSMRLTPEHKVWVVRDGQESRVPVVELTVGERLSRPSLESTRWVASRPLFKEDLRVTVIIQDNLVLDCFDFETDDHYVWLPEADWTVSQCDDMSTTICAIAMALGHEAAFKTIAVDPSRPSEFSHVYALIGVQKGLQTEWWPADTTQKNVSLGWEPPSYVITKSRVWPV